MTGRRQTTCSWTDLPAVSLPNGIRAARFVLGSDADDGDAPVVFRVEFPPGCHVAPHTHESDYCEIILEGRQQVGRTWHGPGTVRNVSGGTAYGPLVAGSEGCTVLVVFRDGRWPAVPVGRGDGDGLHVDVLRQALG